MTYSTKPYFIIETVRYFGEKHCTTTAGTLVIISHGVEREDESPVGGAVVFGDNSILAIAGVDKLLGWKPYFEHVIFVGCAVAAVTPPWRNNTGLFSGDGNAFCQLLANRLDVGVHASTTDMKLYPWHTPNTGDDVMKWVDFLKKAGTYRVFWPQG